MQIRFGSLVSAARGQLRHVLESRPQLAAVPTTPPHAEVYSLDAYPPNLSKVKEVFDRLECLEVRESVNAEALRSSPERVRERVHAVMCRALADELMKHTTVDLENFEDDTYSLMGRARLSLRFWFVKDPERQ